jgi:molybdate transport system regulatory protein
MDDPLKLSLRVRCGNDIAIGPGKALVLEQIDRCGSISAAGRAIGMSYRRTWLLVDLLNRCWTSPLVQTARGGGGGGGTQLTMLGHDVLRLYRAMEARANAAAHHGDHDKLMALLRAEPLPPGDEKASQPDPTA